MSSRSLVKTLLDGLKMKMVKQKSRKIKVFEQNYQFIWGKYRCYEQTIRIVEK